MSQANDKKANCVTRVEFLRDPGAILRRAERSPVIVTDDRGASRMAIHSPSEKLPFIVD